MNVAEIMVSPFGECCEQLWFIPQYPNTFFLEKFLEYLLRNHLSYFGSSEEQIWLPFSRLSLSQLAFLIPLSTVISSEMLLRH